ncbi:MAG: DUF6020 family protein [Clostridia bacterium]
MIDFIQKNRWFAGICAALAAAVLPQISAMLSSASIVINVTACALAFGLFYWLIRCAVKRLNIRLLSFSLVGAYVLSLALVIGRAIFVESHVSLTVSNVLLSLFFALAFTPVLTSLLILFLHGVPRANYDMRQLKMENTRWNPAGWKRSTVFFTVWGILLLFWLPCYLGYFPGIWGYDMYSQNHQALTHAYNTYQPLLHTLLFQGCYQLGVTVFGTGTGGVAVFTTVQTLILSGSLAGVTTYLVKRLNVPFVISIVAVGFYALMPFHAILAVSSTKDTVFSGLFLLCLLQLYDICMDPVSFFKSPGRILLYLGTVLLSCLMRNNMIYAFAVMLPIVVLGVQQKRFWIAVLLAGSLVLSFAGKDLLSRALSATDGPRIEMLSVPIQQLARAYNNHTDELSDVDKQEIFEYLPEKVVQNYYPLLADPIKENATIGDGATSMLGFLKVWGKHLPTYLNDYTDAFLLMTLGYWYPDGNLHAHIYDCYNEPEAEEILGYMFTGFIENINADVKKQSLWRGAESYYQWFAHENNHEKIPVIAWLFNPGFYCWVLFLAVLTLLYFKQYRLALPLALPYGVWMTLLLGPCVIVRYAYPIMACFPLLLGLFWNKTAHYQLTAPAEHIEKRTGRGQEMLRFAAAGAVGFGIDYGCMIVFAEVFGLHYLLATAFAFAISVVTNYLLCAYWVFQGANTKNRGIKAGFLLTSLIGLGLNEWFMYLFVDRMQIHYMLAKLIAVVLVMIWNYFSKRKVLVHRKKNMEDAE